MDVKKLTGMMGLCTRARQCTFGTSGCLDDIKKQVCGVLLISHGASDSTKEKFTVVCSHNSTPLAEIPEDIIEKATGHDGIVMAVRKGGFSDKIMEICRNGE